MTQLERMKAGLIYDACDKEILEMQAPFKQKLYEFNRIKPSESAKKEEYMKEVFAECGENNFIESPFFANWGGHHVHFGSGIYANFNLTLVDDGHIYVGDRVLFGPNVTVATASHPLNAKLRRQEMQFNRDVHIGENVWVGTGVTILPGVTIGKNTVIGAGSVVTRDIPENVLAVGVPCHIVRKIGQRDDTYYYKDEQIDWDNIEALNMLNKTEIFEG